MNLVDPNKVPNTTSSSKTIQIPNNNNDNEVDELSQDYTFISNLYNRNNEPRNYKDAITSSYKNI